MGLAVPSQPLSPGWSRVTLAKRTFGGTLLKQQFKFDIEEHSGDLWGLQNCKEGPDTFNTIRWKSLIIFGAAPIYTLGMMGAGIGHMAYDVAALFLCVLPELIKNVSPKGVWQAFAHFALQVTVEFPLQLASDVWRVARSPLYGLGMMAAAIVAQPCPLEGRKWLGNIEKDWHQGLNYSNDIRYRKSVEEWDDMSCSEFFWCLWEGKVLLLAYCMFKRGNINDKVAGMPRYEPYMLPTKPQPKPGRFDRLWKPRGRK